MLSNVCIKPRYLFTDTVSTPYAVRGSTLNFSFQQPLGEFVLPPIINALEIYQVITFLQIQTDPRDVDAMRKIKAKYRVMKNWQGDPCVPVYYSWEGVYCIQSDNSTNPRVVSLNISFGELTGPIDPAFSNLTSIRKLSRLERSKDGSLSLRFGRNPELCLSAPCQSTKKRKRNGYIIPLVASTVGIIITIALLVALALYCKKRKRRGALGVRNGPLETAKLYFRYSEVVNITDNFERVIGKGGFGKVYHGVLNGEQVAVKILSQESAQGCLI